MRRVYTVLAYAVAVGVVVQAMAIAYAVAGLDNFVNGGGVFDKSVMESDQLAFPEVVGVMVHGLNGGILIPAIALSLLIVSFFAKVPGGVKWAGLVLLLVAIQVNLGYAGHDLPALGAVHGMNALLLLGSAVHTARRVRRAVASPVAEPVERVATRAEAG
jgi:hypothetical protein